MQSTTPVQHNAAYTLSTATLKETTGDWGIRIYDEYMPCANRIYLKRLHTRPNITVNSTKLFSATVCTLGKGFYVSQPICRV